jgi:hypothetical protein
MQSPMSERHTDDRWRTSEEHNAASELGICSDEELREVLVKDHHDGSPIEGLEGTDEHGVPWVERAMEIMMLRRRRKAFAKDPKNPPVTPCFDVEIDTGDATPIADKARRWAEREAQFIMEHHVTQMRARKHIRPGHGPWASNPVLVVPQCTTTKYASESLC